MNSLFEMLFCIVFVCVFKRVQLWSIRVLMRSPASSPLQRISAGKSEGAVAEERCGGSEICVLFLFEVTCHCMI